MNAISFWLTDTHRAQRTQLDIVQVGAQVLCRLLQKTQSYMCVKIDIQALTDGHAGI
jgi:hypothetical protein